MAEASRKTLEELIAAMSQATKTLRRASARLEEQRSAGNMLDMDTVSMAINQIRQIAENIALIETARLVRENAEAARHGIGQLHAEIVTSILIGALVLHHLENTDMTPDEFEGYGANRLMRMCSNLYAVNYASRVQHEQQEPQRDDDDEG